MPEYTEPKYSVKTTHVTHGSQLTITLTGENYGDGPLDTRVEIQGGTLCWVSWPESDEFLKELNDLINKYAI